MRVDRARSLRRIKPERFSSSRPRRDDADLNFVEADLNFVETAYSLGPPFLLDICVYIDGLEGSLPPKVETLLRARTLTHMSTILGESSHNQPPRSRTPPHARAP